MRIPFDTTAATQILVGLMLLFGAAFLVPRGVMLIRERAVGRGGLYALLGLAALFLAVMAFAMALTRPGPPATS